MFRDKVYTEKRRILRQYYVNNADAHKAVKTLAFAVKKEVSDMFIKNQKPSVIIYKLLEYETIVKYLIDGYLAFEIIDDHTVMELDPSTLQCTYKDNKLVWHQYITSSILNPGVADRELDMDKIIYITYYGDEMSFLCSLYNEIIYPYDKEFIFEHVDYILDRFTNKRLDIDKILNIDTILKRGLKIKRLKEDAERKG